MTDVGKLILLRDHVLVRLMELESTDEDVRVDWNKGMIEAYQDVLDFLKN
jgi:hypothetical protein